MPHKDAPKWKVSAFGKIGVGFQHNHAVGPSTIDGPNTYPDLDTLIASSNKSPIQTSTHPPSPKKRRLEHPTLRDLTELIRTVCNDHLSYKSRILQSVEAHVKDLTQKIARNNL
ncbi:MAG: hypothetical protein J3R72DRAFT_428257 [Linnemannia gamsii]|nr:MAG: hypothetical protein J3R72DRAFT_428257 [Linnemannia gamsii]